MLLRYMYFGMYTPVLKVASCVAMETMQFQITKMALGLGQYFMHALGEFASIRKYVIGVQCKSDYPIGKVVYQMFFSYF